MSRDFGRFHEVKSRAGCECPTDLQIPPFARDVVGDICHGSSRLFASGFSDLVARQQMFINCLQFVQMA